MEPNLVSCIIPVFNGELYLREALESVFEQTYRTTEVVVVDDGSTDETPNIAASFQSRVTYIRQDNQGPATARNTAIRAARGEFIAFLDCDDLWEPEKLARQIDRLKQQPEIDLLFTQFQHFWVSDLADEAKQFEGQQMAQPLAAYLMSSLLVRHTAFDKFGVFEDGMRINENMLWFLRAAEKDAAIEVLPDVLTKRRLHSGNITRKHMNDGEFLKTFFPLLKAWRDYQRRHPGA
jgi:glycosyltransferase involved in cell wall biosynthesis